MNKQEQQNFGEKEKVMKKLINLLLVVLLVCLAMPALAQDAIENCDVNFNVDVYKNKYIYENVYIDKDLDLKVDARIDPKEWAEVEVVKCDLNTGNRVIEIFDPRNGTDPDLNVNTIDSSFVGFSGIAQVNQSAGSLNNQGNVTAIAVTNDPNANNEGFASGGWGRKKDDPGLSHTEVSAEQVNTRNALISILVTHTDAITDSFTDFTGIAQVNQASGFMNNQNNVVGISANLEKGAVALSDAFLTQSNANNSAIFAAVNYSATITNSFTGSGIAQVNQSPGSMNNQANIVSFSFAGAQRPAQ
jgi:hypothetical protein